MITCCFGAAPEQSLASISQTVTDLHFLHLSNTLCTASHGGLACNAVAAYACYPDISPAMLMPLLVVCVS